MCRIKRQNQDIKAIHWGPRMLDAGSSWLENTTGMSEVIPLDVYSTFKKK